jgi:hypothetical protein
VIAHSIKKRQFTFNLKLIGAVAIIFATYSLEIRNHLSEENFCIDFVSKIQTDDESWFSNFSCSFVDSSWLFRLLSTALFSWQYFEVVD